MTQRAALYARFSSDLQKDRSIDDQLALCRVHAQRESLKVVATFADRAKSGATLFDRQQLWELMQAAKRKEFDVLVVEALDRLSRDQEDLPGIYKRLEFAGVKIRTCNEGETTKLHIGIRGLVSSLFLSDLGAKVRRGHAGRVREGKFPGAVTYGYRAITGKPGEREIDPEQAKVVLLIFTADVLTRRADQMDDWRATTLPVVGALGVFAVLVMAEPDLATSIELGFIVMSVSRAQ